MPGTELAVVRDEPAAVAQRDIVDGWTLMAASVFKLADHICDTEFVPKRYRGNAPAVAAAILTGRELGIGPLMSLRHVQLVEGSPSLSAEYKRARVLAAGHDFNILEWNSARCRVKGRRRGTNEPPLEVTYTMDDARKAGLIRSRSAWETRPRRMLFARAGTDLCDALFSDVVNGLPTAELLAEGSEEDEFAAYNEADGQQPPKPAARTARRKTAAAGDDTQGQRPAGNQAARPQDDGDSTAQDARPGAARQAAAPSRGAQPLPPLPGEDEPETASDEVAKQEAAPPEQPERDPGKQPDRHRKLVGVVRAHFKRLGYTDSDDAQRLEHTAVLAGTSELGSTNDLDEDELRAVADTLARCRNVEALKALLDAAEAQKAGDGGE